MIITHYQYSAESMLENKAFEEGALYFIEDTQHIYLDPVGGTERIRIAGDIKILSSETDRENLLAPIPGKMYFVLETSKYYIFCGDTWYAGGGNSKPRAGLIYINPSSSLPEGFLWCDGATYSRSDYPELFGAIGTSYGSGDGSTTFNVPDLTTRVPIGAGGDYELGQTGGDEEDTIIIVNQSGNTNTVDTSTHLYTVVNYIISTGKDSETLSVSDIISSMQILPLGIEYGGTGANNAAGALNNLGGASKTYVDTSVSNTKTNIITYTDNSVNSAKNTLTDYIDNKVANIDTGASKEYVDQAIAGINTGASEQYVDNAVSILDIDVREYVDQQIAGINTGASEEYVNNAIREATENIDVDVPTLQEHLAEEDMILSGLQYGTELPSTGKEGQVFFKIVTSSSGNNSGNDNSSNVDLEGYATKEYVHQYAQPNGTAERKIETHNTDTSSHEDIRLLIDGLTTRLNALANSTDEDLDQMAELVAYIKSNKSLIDSITTSKVSVVDIVDNLTTNTSNRPLSAAQGIVLKGLIDAITVPTKLSQMTNDVGFITTYTETDPTVPSWAKQPTKPSYTADEVGALPKTTVIPTVPTNVSAFTNDAGYLTEHQDISGKADKTGMTLGIHTDGLVYLFVDGSPQGNGLQINTDVVEGDVFGYVDENNVIVLNGAIPEGTYTIKYKMEDGSTVDIGNLDLDNNDYWSVNNVLTNCTNENDATQVINNDSYTATINANNGYELSFVNVTMGGTDISASAVNGGNISIANVTGNIEITATATEIFIEPAEPTNFAVPNTTNKTDWSIWCNKARFGSDGGYREGSSESHVVTNYIAMEVGDIIRFEGLNVPTTGTSMNDGMHFSDADKTMLSCSYLEFYTNTNYNYLAVTVTDGVYEIDTSGLSKHEKAKNSKFFRISGSLTGTVDDVVIKVKRNGTWL